MRIPPTPAAAMARDWPKPQKAATTEQAESTVKEQPSAPPGLVRVAAKFEAMAANGQAPGHGQALNSVSRNLARYQETQALVPSEESTEALPSAPTDLEAAADVPVETPDPAASTT